MKAVKQLVAAFEGGEVYTFENDGLYYVESREHAAFDLLDEAEREGVEPTTVRSFPSALSRYGYMVSHGWLLPATADVPALVRELYQLIRRFEDLFPGRHFTPDGHLVGSIGEVLAAHRYDLTLLPASHLHHDATCNRTSRSVEVKATQGARVALRGQPAHLLVLKLEPDGTAKEIYNGPGALPWQHAGPRQSNGQRSISLSKLRSLMGSVQAEDMILQVRT